MAMIMTTTNIFTIAIDFLLILLLIICFSIFFLLKLVLFSFHVLCFAVWIQKGCICMSSYIPCFTQCIYKLLIEATVSSTLSLCLSIHFYSIIFWFLDFIFVLCISDNFEIQLCWYQYVYDGAVVTFFCKKYSKIIFFPLYQVNHLLKCFIYSD